LMGLTTQAWQVFSLRVLQGAVGGAGAPLTTLAALTLPPRRLSFGMGLFQTAQFVGVSVGPAIGGLSAGLIRVCGRSHLTAALMVVNALLALFVIREPKLPEPHGRSRGSLRFREQLAFVWRVPRLRGPVLATLTFQMAYAVSVALLPLHLYALSG